MIECSARSVCDGRNVVKLVNSFWINCEKTEKKKEGLSKST